MSDRDALNERMLRAMLAGPTPEQRERQAADAARLGAECKASLERIAESMLGIRPEHSDSIYTQHPVMAGVIRKALDQAYAEGLAAMLMHMLRDKAKP